MFSIVRTAFTTTVLLFPSKYEFYSQHFDDSKAGKYHSMLSNLLDKAEYVCILWLGGFIKDYRCSLVVNSGDIHIV